LRPESCVFAAAVVGTPGGARGTRGAGAAVARPAVRARVVKSVNFMVEEGGLGRGRGSD
jgi:hypothetical protein